MMKRENGEIPLLSRSCKLFPFSINEYHWQKSWEGVYRCLNKSQKTCQFANFAALEERVSNNLNHFNR